MIDHPPGASPPSADAVLDAAAKAAAQPQPTPPRFRMVRANMPQVIATLFAYTTPANQALEAAFRKHLESHPGAGHEAVRDVDHHEAVRAWCEQHPAEAASIVLCALYLASARFAVQDAVEQPEEAAEVPTVPTAESPTGPYVGPATGVPRVPVEMPADGSPATITGDGAVPAPPVEAAPEATAGT